MKVYILLDRSGSMSSQWDDTIGAVNTYAKNLDKNTDVYIAAFDSGYNSDISYTTLRDSNAGLYEDIKPNEISPRGGTPLLDAMGRLLDTALSDNPEKAYIVIMTDGYENTSKKFSKQTISEKLARVEDRNWEVVFLGANFDRVTDQATSLGLGLNKTYNISTANLKDEMSFMAGQTVAYASCGIRTSFSDADRVRATTVKK